MNIREKEKEYRNCRISKAETLLMLLILFLSPLFFQNLIQIVLRGLGFLFWVFWDSLGWIWVKWGFYRYCCPKTGLKNCHIASWYPRASSTAPNNQHCGTEVLSSLLNTALSIAVLSSYLAFLRLAEFCMVRSW